MCCGRRSGSWGYHSFHYLVLYPPPPPEKASQCDVRWNCANQQHYGSCPSAEALRKFMSYDLKTPLMSCPRTRPILAHSPHRPPCQPVKPAFKTVPFIPISILLMVDILVLPAVSQNFSHGLFGLFRLFVVVASIHTILTPSH